MIRDMMVQCIEKRFAASCAPHPVEWLSDNGSIFAVRKTIEIALAQPRPCFPRLKVRKETAWPRVS